jgi:hypothetical protein
MYYSSYMGASRGCSVSVAMSFPATAHICPNVVPLIRNAVSWMSCIVGRGSNYPWLGNTRFIGRIALHTYSFGSGMCLTAADGDVSSYRLCLSLLGGLGLSCSTVETDCE